MYAKNVWKLVENKLIDSFLHHGVYITYGSTDSATYILDFFWSSDVSNSFFVILESLIGLQVNKYRIFV